MPDTPRPIKPNQATNSEHETVSLTTSEADETIEEVTPSAPTGRARTTISKLASNIPPFHSPPSWIEWFGARLAFWVLVFIGVIVAAFMIVWWTTMPTLEAFAQRFGTNDPKQLMELFIQAREAHTQWVLDFFRSVVVSTLLPIFTLLAGYAFGSSQRRDNKDGNGDDQ